MVHAANPVAPIAAHQLLIFLLQAGLLLLLALLMGRLAMRYKMPAVVGELSVGVILGPSLLDHVAPGLTHWLLPKEPGQFHLLDASAQIGLLLLVGLTGMHMDLGLVRRRAATAAGISIAGLLIPLGLGIGAGYLMPAEFLGTGGHRSVFALFLGVAMCVSAVPVIAKTLLDLKLVHRNIGQLTLTAGMVDDAVGWVLLSVVAAMATTGVRAGDLTMSLVWLVVVIAFAATIGRPIVRITLGLAARSRDAGPTTAVCVVIVLLASAATQAMKLEAVFGAFVAGILISSCGGIGPARLGALRTMVMAVLAPLFFATAGLRMDLTALGRPRVLVATLALLFIAIAGKFAGAYLGARLNRLNRWEALALGAGMNARGVVEVVVAMVGLRLGVLGTETYTIVVLIAIVTSLMAPPILRTAMSRVEYTAEEQLRKNSHEGSLSAADGDREMAA
ncbi:cation:proton antiporter [Actinomadura scrupuli]|uniref:cation:proton antiporter n=1 Tax=Actinomadura scrupuli TaxID=559629 RepID=UPI003D97AD14